MCPVTLPSHFEIERSTRAFIQVKRKIVDTIIAEFLFDEEEEAGSEDEEAGSEDVDRSSVYSPKNDNTNESESVRSGRGVEAAQTAVGPPPAATM